MKQKLSNYEVSSAGWSIQIDEFSEKSAALSALIFMLNKNKRELLLSTTIMVNKIVNLNTTDIMDASFFLTSSILKEIGEEGLSKGLSQLTEDLNEIKSITG